MDQKDRIKKTLDRLFTETINSVGPGHYTWKRRFEEKCREEGLDLKTEWNVREDLWRKSPDYINGIIGDERASNKEAGLPGIADKETSDG